MLRRLAIESGIIFTLTSLLLVVAATVGLPGRTESPRAEAAEDDLIGAASQPVQDPSGPTVFESIR